MGVNLNKESANSQAPSLIPSKQDTMSTLQPQVILHTFCGGCGKEATPALLCSPCTEEREQDPKALRQGFVSLQEILEGQHVTGEQFFNAVRDANFPLEEESYVGNNPKTMSGRQLHAAMDEVDEDRKQLSRRNRNRVWSKEDEELMDAMNDWAAKVFEEILARRGT